jgi:hypothetical protein
MIELILILNIISKDVLGFEHPNHPGEFYTSGVGDKRIYNQYHADSFFALAVIPQKFRYNLYYEPLPAGYYLLEPVFNNGIPTQINFRQKGNIMGTASVVDYKELSYYKEKPSANILIINNGQMAQINLKQGNYEIQALVKLLN